MRALVSSMRRNRYSGAEGSRSGSSRSNWAIAPSMLNISCREAAERRSSGY